MSRPAKSQFQAVPAALPRLEDMPQRLKPVEVAAYLTISVDAVMAFKDGGELEFINVATPGAKRPTWRITRASLAQFEASRKTKTNK